ncbi:MULTISPECIES: tocopherol cyclase family protein [unclassified Synechocystis]|uniref:tocopherol cyclase family protein n=1 Tax=unclassified Synechocystis TaxID=2640012 RepID=UPI00041C9680|nr:MULTISPECIES: tocopherol cyclase family protein [unclassified Synechocystis]AIE74217.1 2-methyl-6-phytyl-1,4-benzoquinone cyclase / 2,3-dimethyl-6-phytyl-1,4-benzoquinone cyclase / Tocopherol cyclase [Synechocystis sp. PCC 6714]MCT0252848.1 tocopherol cyclase family protein [Synechocystis sp. CS-94]
MEFPPHCGYHWQGQSPFFEGWYVRLLLPHSGESFAFMYSIENPAGDFAEIRSAVRHYSGGAVQILGPTRGTKENQDDQLIWRTFPSVKNFWASPCHFALGHWGKYNGEVGPRPIPAGEFFTTVEEGYQIYQHQHQGQIALPDRHCRWHFTVEPEITWGSPQCFPKATAGWLSFLPLFDPGWQILLAQGRGQGWLEWQGERYEFDQALVYAEKNWGHSFPSRWFWLQANHFPGHPGLSVTAAGGERIVLGHPEEVALIGVHFQGNFYEFGPGNSTITWQVARWGRWQLKASNDRYWVTLSGKTEGRGSLVHTPTAQGLQLNCRDTTRGYLHLQWGSVRHGLIGQGETYTAGLEVGGNWGLD